MNGQTLYLSRTTGKSLDTCRKYWSLFHYMAGDKPVKMFWRLLIPCWKLYCFKQGACFKYMTSDIIDEKWYEDRKAMVI